MHTHLHICAYSTSIWWFAEEKGILAIVTFISPYTKMAPLYSCSSIHHSPSVHLPAIHRFIHPSLHPSIHLPALRPLHPLNCSLSVCDRCRECSSVSLGPKQSNGPLDKLQHSPASPSSASQLFQSRSLRLGCSTGVFPPSDSHCGPCVSVCVEYSESPGHLPPMQVRMNQLCVALLPRETQAPWKYFANFVFDAKNVFYTKLHLLIIKGMILYCFC